MTKKGTAASKKKQQKKKIVITSLAVGATGILGYFGWQYYKKKRGTGGSTTDIETLIKNMDQPIVLTPDPPKLKPRLRTTTYSAPPKMEPDSFPLKKGSKGANVRRLQDALIAKYGKSILPKYGADGDFGSEVVAALKKLGLPATITESVLNVISQGAGADPTTVGNDLYKATVSKNYSAALSQLQKLRTVDDYSRANEVFKQNRIAGVRQTIVNGLLSVFTTEIQKQKIKFEFLRMGLQFDGSKWSLSGFDGQPIVTVLPTSVWLNATESVPVPARMVLGNEVSHRLDYTLFENGGRHFLVQTKSIKYL